MRSRFTFTWWHVAWFLLFMSGLVFRGRTAAEINNSAIDAWALYRIGLVGLVGVILFVRLTLRKTRWLTYLFSGYIGLFLIFGALSLVSTAWSVLPPWTLYKSVEFLVDLSTLAAVIATMQDVEEYRRFVNWTWILLGSLLVTAWIGAVVDPGEALYADPNLRMIPLQARLYGVFPVISCNDLSEIAATIGMVALVRLWVDPEGQAHKLRYRLLFAFSLVTVIITQTRGTYMAFLIAFVALLLLTRRYILAAAGGFATVMIGGALLLLTNFGSSASNFVNRGQNSTQSGGLSGRLETWTNAYYKILEHPILGYGGFAGSRFVVLDKNSVDSSSLNSFIDAALNIGIVGPILLLLLLVLIGWVLYRNVKPSPDWLPENVLALEMFLAFIILVIRSVESSNLLTHPIFSFLAIIGAAQVLRQERKAVFAMPPQQSLSWESPPTH